MGKAIEKVKINPGVKRTRHTKEFKLEAVRLLELGQWELKGSASINFSSRDFQET